MVWRGREGHQSQKEPDLKDRLEQAIRELDCREQNTVEVVNLVLHAGRPQAVKFTLMDLAIKAKPSDLDLLRAFNIRIHLRQRQTAFLVDIHL